MSEQPTIPPDPEGMNEERADWAFRACSTFTRQTAQTDAMRLVMFAVANGEVSDETREAAAEVIGDLVTGLHHLADRQGVAWDVVLASATDHYAVETHEEPPTEEPCACGMYGNGPEDHSDDCPLRGWHCEPVEASETEGESSYYRHCDCGCGTALHGTAFVVLRRRTRRSDAWSIPWFAVDAEHAARVIDRVMADPFTVVEP